VSLPVGACAAAFIASVGQTTTQFKVG